MNVNLIKALWIKTNIFIKRNFRKILRIKDKIIFKGKDPQRKYLKVDFYLKKSKLGVYSNIKVLEIKFEIPGMYIRIWQAIFEYDMLLWPDHFRICIFEYGLPYSNITRNLGLVTFQNSYIRIHIRIWNLRIRIYIRIWSLQKSFFKRRNTIFEYIFKYDGAILEYDNSISNM